MVSADKCRFLVNMLLLLNAMQSVSGRLRTASTLRSIGKKFSMDFDSVNIGKAGQAWGSYVAGGGLLAYRSSVISSLSQMDRGEKEAAMETLKVAIASLALESTQAFGLPVMSVVVDKIVTKYGSRFPQTIGGLKSYNQMLGDAILKQTDNVASPGLLNKATETLDLLDTLKNRIRTDFGNEVTSFLQSSQAYDDLVRPLQNAKTWAKVAKWADFLAGPLFDAANIAFTGWQLHGAIQSGDQLAVASGSIGIAGSIIGIGTFVVGSLATSGGILAATAGPVGAIIGCILTLASLIINVINEYIPAKKINEHLQLVRSLTTASIDTMKGLHYETLKSVANDDVKVGFSTIFDVNQAMLVEASIHDKWDTVKGLQGGARLRFAPELVKREKDYLVVGNLRVFEKKNYANWIFKPTGTEEIGYNYYGKKVTDQENGIFVRLNTDMITNKDTNMWFWMNGADITTYEAGKENVAADDNVNIGDFRTFLTTSDRCLEVNTGAGNDLLQLTGIICSSEQQKLLSGKCLRARMGDGSDTISFEGMDIRGEKRTWLLDNSDLSQTKKVIGVVCDFTNDWLSYRVKDDDDAITDVRFGVMHSVEGFIGSPLNDIVKFDDSKDYLIRETTGRNVYEFYMGRDAVDRQYIIEDNSNTPGKLVIHKSGLTWRNVIFHKSTNIIMVIVYRSKDRSRIVQIFLKRSKPGLMDFKVKVGTLHVKKISEMASFDNTGDIIFPFTPYSYRFNKNLIARLDQPTYVELGVPEGDYPTQAVTYGIKFVNEFGNLILTDELLQLLRTNTYTLTAKRRGTPASHGSWKLKLTKPNKSGGWRINVGKAGTFVVGVPGSFQFISSLPKEERMEVNVYLEYQAIMRKGVFDGRDSFYGSEEPDKVVLKYPRGLSSIDPVAQRVIDLKGPEKPSETERNELVIDDSLIGNFFKHDLSRYCKMELERASLDTDWHLKIFSNWGNKILRVDATLKNVHAIVAGPNHERKFILDLAGSQETSYDLNLEMWFIFYSRYSSY